MVWGPGVRLLVGDQRQLLLVSVWTVVEMGVEDLMVIVIEVLGGAVP